MRKAENRSISVELQQSWRLYADLKKKCDVQDTGRDDRGLGSRDKETSACRTEPRRESCPAVMGSREEGRSSRASTVNPTIRAPHRFNAEHYQGWKEELSFWREIHAFASDNTLIAELALGSNDAIRHMLVIFLRDAREKIEERTFGRLLLILGGNSREIQRNGH